MVASEKRDVLFMISYCLPDFQREVLLIDFRRVRAAGVEEEAFVNEK